jgi:molecular chaperone DnaJ
MGGEIEIPTLDGKKIKFKLPAGIQSGEETKVSGKGMPSLRGTRTGDLILHVRLETPKNLTKRQEELFRELAEIDQKNISPHRKSFLEKLKGLFGNSESESSKENNEV